MRMDHIEEQCINEIAHRTDSFIQINVNIDSLKVPGVIHGQKTKLISKA